MLKISNVKVYGLEESIIASGYPMLSKPYTNSDFEDKAADINSILFFDSESKADLTWAEKRIKTAKHLGGTNLGEGHSTYLSGIVVQFDVRYPVYWTPQFQRYHFQQIISSQSSMHRLTKMNLDESFNEFVLPEMKMKLRNLINIYNEALSKGQKTLYKCLIKNKLINSLIEISFSLLKEESFENYEVINEEISIEDLYMYIISNCPQGLEKTMRVSTNYLQLKTMYLQRKNHKLYDWHEFCQWIETLPYFKKLTGIES